MHLKKFFFNEQHNSGKTTHNRGCRGTILQHNRGSYTAWDFLVYSSERWPKRRPRKDPFQQVWPWPLSFRNKIFEMYLVWRPLCFQAWICLVLSSTLMPGEFILFLPYECCFAGFAVDGLGVQIFVPPTTCFSSLVKPYFNFCKGTGINSINNCIALALGFSCLVAPKWRANRKQKPQTISRSEVTGEANIN